MREQPLPKEEDDDKHRCKLFRCDFRSGYFCCNRCYRRNICKKTCLNDRQRCGQAYVLEEDQK